MRRSGIRCLVVIVVTVVLTYMPAVTSAATYAQLYAAKNSEQNTQQRLYANSLQMNQTEKQLLALKASLNQLDGAISATNTKIADQQAVLVTLKRKEELEKKTRQQLIQQFNAILVNTYENGGNLQYLSVLLGANSWADFVARLHEIKLILLHNYNIQQQIIRESQLIKSQEFSISRHISTLQDMVNQSRQMVLVKKNSLAKEQAILSSLSQSERRMEMEKASQLAAINNIQMELLAQQEQARLYAKYGPHKSSGLTPAIAQPVHVGQAGISSMISYAEDYLGTPYVWGGTTPSPGFDCSGFTQYVLRHSGVVIQRTSEQQYLEGAPVARSQLEPGDLVFFTTYAPGASHVGIYVGNGLMIDAEDYGVVFDNISNSYWGPRYLGARRIVEP